MFISYLHWSLKKIGLVFIYISGKVILQFFLILLLETLYYIVFFYWILQLAQLHYPMDACMLVILIYSINIILILNSSLRTFLWTIS